MRHSYARKSAVIVAVMAAMTFSAQAASAQKKGGAGGFSAGGFNAGYTDIGPAIGLGNIGSASASFGGRFEHAIKPLPDLGNGTLGIEASFDYYSWRDTPFYRWSYTPIGVTANYHFRVSEPRFDPFLGAGLGFSILNCTYSGPFNTRNDCGNSALYFIGRAGMRWFFQPNLAGYVDVGAGAATLNLGLMFKIS
jgi:hypothetical protein